MQKRYLLLSVSSVLLGLLGGVRSGWAADRVDVTLYHAVLSGDSLQKVIELDAQYEEDYRLLAFALAARCGALPPYFVLALEMQAVKHFGKHEHEEFNLLFVERWNTFPWNRLLLTSLAVGQGLSYATAIPPLERRYHDMTSQLLGYLMFEVRLALPPLPRFGVVGRIHHRSGASGLFNDVVSGSNGVGLGVTFRF